MKLTQEHTEQIKGIMASMDCSKEFKCYKSNFENICLATDRGLNSLAGCGDAGSTTCEFRVPFGDGAFCRCPLRVYVAKHLNK